MSVAFTGHRPESLPFGDNEQSEAFLQLKRLLLEEIKYWAHQGYTTFYEGAARGMDIVFGEQVLLAKEQGHPGVKLVSVVPFEEQAARWNEAWRERYFALMKNSDDEVLISAHYTKECFHQRNRYMVDHSDVLIAVYDGLDSGGTAYTVQYAMEKGKTIIIFDPSKLTRFVIPAQADAT
ncbi:DUF1273 domain-containing protein [Eubacteriales bacterium OttesenSCG-928-A19]|nr:DUF1273 domain-containing protein [Eubacteriales bacterium OttesenSCG-928-A19]